MNQNTHKTAIWATVTVFLLVGLFYFSVGGEQVGQTKIVQPVKIGVLIPLTGKFANLGEDVKNALELARVDVKSRTGMSLDLVYEDSAADPKVAVEAANKLVQFDKVDLIIAGPGSSANLAVLPVLEKGPNGQPVFIAISSTPKLNTAGRHVIKAQHDIDVEARFAAKYLFEKGFRSVGVMYDSTSDTLMIGKDVFTETFSALGGKVIDTESYDGKGVPDFKTQLTKLKSSQPDALYFLAIEKVAGPLVKQARGINLRQPIFGFAGLESSEFLKGAGEAAEGVSFTGLPFSCGGSVDMRAYCTRYAQKYSGRVPLAYGVYGYDILSIVGESIGRSGGLLDKEAIITAFEGKELQGVNGTLVFDGEGNIQIVDFPIRTVKNGKFVEVK